MKSQTPTPPPLGLVLATMALFDLNGPEAQRELRRVAPVVTRALARAFTQSHDGNTGAADVQEFVGRHFRDRLDESERKHLDALLGASDVAPEVVDEVAWQSTHMALLTGLVAGWQLREQIAGGAR